MKHLLIAISLSTFSFSALSADEFLCPDMEVVTQPNLTSQKAIDTGWKGTSPSRTIVKTISGNYNIIPLNSSGTITFFCADNALSAISLTVEGYSRCESNSSNTGYNCEKAVEEIIITEDRDEKLLELN